MYINYVREKRIEKGLTLRELAELSGVSKSQISDVERCKSIPTFTVMNKIAKALEIEQSKLFVETDG